jgi:hypothetical protein
MYYYIIGLLFLIITSCIAFISIAIFSILIWIFHIGCVLRGLLQLRNKGPEGSNRKTFKIETRSTIFRTKERNPPNFETGGSSCKVVKTNAFTDFVDMTRALIKLARANGLSEDVEELLEKRQKQYQGSVNIGLLHTETS